MTDLVRFSISIEKNLFDLLEDHVANSDYKNRSEFIRDLIRSHAVEEEWRSGNELMGTISMLYDHHVPGLSERLTHQQHHFPGKVLATTHVHLDEHLCAEMIMVRGPGKDIKLLCDRLGRERGVLHTKLATTSTGLSLR